MYQHKDLVHNSFPSEETEHNHIGTQMAGDVVYGVGNVSGAVKALRENKRAGESTEPLDPTNMTVMPDIEQRLKNTEGKQ